MNSPLDTTIQASQRLLDSDHLAVTALMLVIGVLAVMLFYTTRLLQQERQESRRLTDIIIKMQERVAEIVKAIAK